MMMRTSLVFALSTAALVGGCGGTEPLSAISRGVPQLGLPVADIALVGVIQRYSQVTTPGFDGIEFTVNGQSVLAPAGGIISAVDNTLGAATVYIYHGPHLTTRISRLQTLNVRAGEIALVGSVLGISSNTGQPFRLSVLYDGAVVCPQSYFTAAAQSALVTRAGGLTLCD